MHLENKNKALFPSAVPPPPPPSGNANDALCSYIKAEIRQYITDQHFTKFQSFLTPVAMGRQDHTKFQLFHGILTCQVMYYPLFSQMCQFVISFVYVYIAQVRIKRFSINQSSIAPGELVRGYMGAKSNTNSQYFHRKCLTGITTTLQQILRI